MKTNNVTLGLFTGSIVNSQTRKRNFYREDTYTDALKEKFDEIVDTIKAKFKSTYAKAKMVYRQRDDLIAEEKTKTEEEKNEIMGN